MSFYSFSSSSSCMMRRPREVRSNHRTPPHLSHPGSYLPIPGQAQAWWVHSEASAIPIKQGRTQSLRLYRDQPRSVHLTHGFNRRRLTHPRLFRVVISSVKPKANEYQPIDKSRSRLNHSHISISAAYTYLRHVERHDTCVSCRGE